MLSKGEAPAGVTNRLPLGEHLLAVVTRVQVRRYNMEEADQEAR